MTNSNNAKDYDFRPRFLPDRQLKSEWPRQAQILSHLILKGLPVVPVAAFGISASKEWLDLEKMPTWDFQKTVETIWGQLCGQPDWPLDLRLGHDHDLKTIRIEKMDARAFESALFEMIQFAKKNGLLDLPLWMQPAVSESDTQFGTTEISLEGIADVLNQDRGWVRFLGRLGLGDQPLKKWILSRMNSNFPDTLVIREHMTFAFELAARHELTQGAAKIRYHWAYDGSNFFLCRLSQD